MLKNILLIGLVLLVGCDVGSTKYEFEQGQQCDPYVDKYLSFHKLMIGINDIDKSSVLLDYVYVLPDIIANPEKLSLHTSAYIKREREILDISEYFVECDSSKDYAVIWFKIKNTDPRFKWLYIVIADGIMRTTSKELDFFLELEGSEPVNWVKINGKSVGSDSVDSDQ